MSTQQVPLSDLLEIMEHMFRFPQATVCRHYVVCELLQVLEKNGIPFPASLADAAVFSRDELGLSLLADMRAADGN